MSREAFEAWWAESQWEHTDDVRPIALLAKAIAWEAWHTAERAAAQKVGEADLCLQAVAAARAAIKADMGDNIAFLDDDLVRWVTTAREQERRATAARCRELCADVAHDVNPNVPPMLAAVDCAAAIAREFGLDAA